MLSKRDFLASSISALTLAGCANNGLRPIQPRGKIEQIGIQTYTLRDQMRADAPATLSMIKQAGYDYVELNGRDFAETPTDVLAVQVAEAGLYAPSTHLSYEPVREDTANMIKACQTLDCKFGIVPWIDEGERSLDDWKRHARVLNEAGKQFADNGVTLAYHNHQFEFDDLGGGTTAMQILMEGTDPDAMSFQIDIFWALLAKIDLPALFRTYPGRFKLSHIKDLKGDPDTLGPNASYETIAKTLMVNVGEGDIDFAALFALNNVSGMEYFITEHDLVPAPAARSIKISHDTVRALRF